MKELKHKSPQQLEEEANGYIYIENQNGKAERKSTKKSDLYEAYKKYNDTLEPIAEKYHKYTREAFLAKVEEAKIYLETGVSEYITANCKKGETETELANKIIKNDKQYKLLQASAEKELREALDIIEEKYNNT